MSTEMSTEKVNIFRCAQQGQKLSVEVSLKNLATLSGLLASYDGRINANFRFSFLNENRDIVVVHGDLSSNLSLQCQRCLGDFAHDVASNFAIAYVRQGTRAENIDDKYEIIETNFKDNLCLYSFLAEELILCLPLIAKHPVSVCSIKQDDTSVQETEEKFNPFMNL